MKLETTEQAHEGKQDSAVVSALLRLQRAGSEHSRTTEKLRDAANVIAHQLCEVIAAAGLAAGLGADIPLLPREYGVCRTNDSMTLVQWREGGEESLYQFVPNANWPKDIRVSMSKADAQQFSNDVAAGLLDEIAAFLEKRAAENEAAAATLEAAKV